MTLSHKDQPVLSFDTQDEWREWLSQNYSTVDGIWLRLYKKASAIQKVNYAQALDEALCFGWIDGIVNKYDDVSYLQKFTPRKSKSTWSEINKGHIAKLTQLGKMTESGIFEVERTKADGRWDAAYGSSSIAKIPDDFLGAINKNKKARQFWETLNKTNKYAMIWLVSDARKQKTRVRRIDKFVGMLEKGEKLY